jgi:hypothetical protein
MSQIFSLVVVVWGERYTRFFGEVCLPTLLTPGNLPGLRNLPHSCLHIYTTHEDEARLAKLPAFEAVWHLLPVVVHHIKLDGQQSKYDRMNACHRDAVEDAQRDGKAVVVLSPDCLFSAHCLTHAEKLLDAGAQAIAVPGLLGLWEELEPAAKAHVKANVLSLSGRELLALALKHLHPFQKTFFVDAPSFSGWPVMYLWKIPGEGLLARYFHLHPLVIKPKPDAPPPKTTIDFDYVEHACEPEHIHVIRDSDEMAVVSLCPAADNQKRGTGQPLDIETAAAAIANHVTPLHERYAALNLRLHETSCLSPRWEQAEAEAEKCIAAVLAARRRYLDDPAWAKQVDARRQRVRFLTKLRRVFFR